MKRRHSSTGKKAGKPTRKKASKPVPIKPVRKPKTTTLRAGPGHYQVTGHSAELILRAKQVEKAMTRLPPGALHTNRKDAIRRNLSVVTDGAVGGPKAVLKSKSSRKGTKRRTAKRGDLRPEKSSAVQSLKRITRNLAEKAATKAAEQAGGIAVSGLLTALWKLVEILSH